MIEKFRTAAFDCEAAPKIILFLPRRLAAVAMAPDSAIPYSA